MAARQSKDLSVQWEAVGSNDDVLVGGQSSAGNWREFLCAVIGHRIYVLRILVDLGGVGKIFVLDLQTQSWHTMVLSGSISVNILGGSIVTWDGKLAFIKRDTFRLRTVQFLDTILLEWSEREVYGDHMYLGSRNVSDFWEERRIVLINAEESGSDTPNVTFVMNADTLELHRLTTKGPSPSRRSQHSSVLVEQQKKWLIVGGTSSHVKGYADICILDFRTSVPTWTTVKRFSKLKYVMSCSLVLTGSSVLIIGGKRHGLPSSFVCSYDLRTGRVKEGVLTLGSRPYMIQFDNLKAVKPNMNEFVMVSARKRVGMSRVFKGKLDF